MKKYCIGCKDFLKTTLFYKDKRNSDGLYARCKYCHSDYGYKYANSRRGRKNNRERQRRFQAKRRALALQFLVARGIAASQQSKEKNLTF